MRLLILSLLALTTIAKPTVYLIRHGEKPECGENLSRQGRQRAQCLRNVFGENSQYNIGYILAEKPKHGEHLRPYETVKPLAHDLKKVIHGGKVDTHCEEGNATCVKEAVSAYKGRGNVLICWEHKHLTKIVKALGVTKKHKYPDDRFDLIWTLDYGSRKLADDKTSEECCFGDPGAKCGAVPCEESYGDTQEL